MEKCRAPAFKFYKTLFSARFRYYATGSDRKKICVIGSGPAGFYTTQHLLKNKLIEVDIYEKLPVPFGLIRYGVAPDHPEIKIVTNSFTKIALDERCNFFGNINVGKDVTVSELLNEYHAVVLACGASEDKILGIPGEDSLNVKSAKNFVGWYNGHPQHMNEEFNLDTETAAVIGHGNVALDVARILLKDVEELKSTDITDYALQTLKQSKLKRVILVGRRGPLQVSFTIKELREMVKLPGCDVIMKLKDFEGIPELLPSLPRPRKRLIELMYDTANNRQKRENTKSWELKFFRSPKEIISDAEGRVTKFIFGVNKVEGNAEDAKLIKTEEEEILECGLVLRSVGYKSMSIDPFVPFDETKHIVPNDKGKVVGIKGLYCSGWIKTGPVGVILSTMYGSYETAEHILQDIEKGELPSKQLKGRNITLDLLSSTGVKFVTFNNWLNLEKVEQGRGESLGKPREKVCDVEEMLKIAHGIET